LFNSHLYERNNRGTLIRGRCYRYITLCKKETEKKGIINNVVFSCGAVVIKNKLFFYYGAADKFIAVVTFLLPELLDKLRP